MLASMQHTLPRGAEREVASLVVFGVVFDAIFARLLKVLLEYLLWLVNYEPSAVKTENGVYKCVTANTGRFTLSYFAQCPRQTTRRNEILCHAESQVRHVMDQT